MMLREIFFSSVAVTVCLILVLILSLKHPPLESQEAVSKRPVELEGSLPYTHNGSSHLHTLRQLSTPSRSTPRITVGEEATTKTEGREGNNIISTQRKTVRDSNMMGSGRAVKNSTRNITDSHRPDTGHSFGPPRSHLFNNPSLESADEILSSAWTARLKEMLGMPGVGRTISVVFGNYAYLDSTLNWLVAAKVKLQPPLEDVIIFCLDAKLFSFLDERKIPSIHVDPATIVNNATKLATIWLARLVIYRTINYFGHNVMAFDSDAIVLRNPKKLIEEHQESDIISSAGKYPFYLSKRWGFTACMGVIFFRSTPKTELLWNSINSRVADDQRLLNEEINKCHIQWQSVGKNIKMQSINGRCANGLTVTVVSHANICRYWCGKSDREAIYVWHKISPKNGESKIATAKAGKVWFLKDGWKKIDLKRHSNDLEGNRLLEALSVT